MFGMSDPQMPKILVVEDEFLIRLTLTEALGDEGFTVIEAETGDAALSVLERSEGISLLLTDIQLPGTLDGHALAREARRRIPDLPVIYMTGRPDHLGAAASGRDMFIAKPYTLADICDAARRLTGSVSV